MSEQSLISVIVPVYNVEKYLRPCVESILEQTYKNIEVILVNDGSTDKSKAICLELAEKDKRISYYEKANSGLSDTRNVGLEKAKGEYIAFVDSDDLLAPNAVRTLYELCRKYDTGIAVGKISHFVDGEQPYYKTQTRENVFGKDEAICNFLYSHIAKKYIRETQFVNGLEIAGVCTENPKYFEEIPFITQDYDRLLEEVDAVYIVSTPEHHYEQIQSALEKGRHVLCEPPVALNERQSTELFSLAAKKGCILMDALKTAYATAYSRLLLLAKEGKIGEIYSVDATCTSLRSIAEDAWDSICDWGPTAMLPILNILRNDYKTKNIITHIDDEGHDQFTRITFLYDHAVASATVAKWVKSEGELIISGTRGYIYVPAPWWKTDYFEIRYEDASQNKRYFYQLDGEGIRYELVAFIRAIGSGRNLACVDSKVSNKICEVIGNFYSKVDCAVI